MQKYAGLAVGIGVTAITTLEELNRIPVGTYSMYTVSIKGYYEENIFGIGPQTKYYDHEYNFVDVTIGTSTTYEIISEHYYSYTQSRR